MFEPSSRNWPRLKAAADKRHAPRREPQPELRILLAEDAQICIDMMLAMAERLDVRMETASNGLDAIGMVHEAAARGAPYSLLLLDVVMPILDGVETARRIRADGIGPDELPIVAVTASVEPDELRSFRSAGIQAFLEKPVGLAELRATLNAWGHRTSQASTQVRSPAMAVLRGKYEQRKLQTLARIEDALAGDHVDEDMVLELRTMLHQIAGTAGSFGDQSLGEVMRACEVDLIANLFQASDVRPVLSSARDALRARIAR